MCVCVCNGTSRARAAGKRIISLFALQIVRCVCVCVHFLARKLLELPKWERRAGRTDRYQSGESILTFPRGGGKTCS